MSREKRNARIAPASLSSETRAFATEVERATLCVGLRERERERERQPAQAAALDIARGARLSPAPPALCLLSRAYFPFSRQERVQKALVWPSGRARRPTPNEREAICISLSPQNSSTFQAPRFGHDGEFKRLTRSVAFQNTLDRPKPETVSIKLKNQRNCESLLSLDCGAEPGEGPRSQRRDTEEDTKRRRRDAAGRRRARSRRTAATRRRSSNCDVPASVTRGVLLLLSVG